MNYEILSHRIYHFEKQKIIANDYLTQTYSSQELQEILEKMCKQNDYELDKLAKEKIQKYLCDVVQNKDENFANGRMVRNMYDDLVMNHARRVIKIHNPQKEDLLILLEEDFVNL